MRYLSAFLACFATSVLVLAGDGNRLSYLDSNEVWYPHKDFPKLITPQWVGEDGVECVVVLAIDDMRDTAKYEAYLRPILQRLKQIDGRAPVSIMTNSVKPDDPQLQTWLQEGLSLECHTADHPCPLLAGGSGVRIPVPSLPSSGERARVRGSSGENGHPLQADATLPPSPRRGGPGRGADEGTGIDSKAAPLPNPPRRGEGTKQESPPHPNPLPPKAGGEGTGEQPPKNAQQSPGLLKAKATYDKCVDLMASIPNNNPVAFRTPCCDSLNTVSPRFFSEIINQTTPGGNSLQLDSSVFTLYTADDPSIPRELLTDPDGREKFRKYIPRKLARGNVVHDGFVNTIENYPYPYVIQRLCWEFPCMVPSDWSANHLHKPNNPDTVRDLKAALDITVLKQGVFNLVFHPHGWIKAEQVIELIDHAVAQHGQKVKFLNFRECVERLNKNLLLGKPLRDEFRMHGENRLLDVDADGSMDVILAGAMTTSHEVREKPIWRRWQQDKGTWKDNEFPLPLRIMMAHNYSPLGERFGVISAKGRAAFISNSWLYQDKSRQEERPTYGVWQYDQTRWAHGLRVTETLSNEDRLIIPAACQGVRLRDLNGDGICEIVVGSKGSHINGEWLNEAQHEAYGLSQSNGGWEKLAFRLPEGVAISSLETDKTFGVPDAGLHFVDLNEDGKFDIVFSNHERFGAWLFESMEKGWSIELLNVKRGEKPAGLELPPIVREDGSNNGFFVRDRQLCWINEDTDGLPDFIMRVAFDKLLGDRLPDAKSPEAAKQSMRVAPGYRVDLVAHEPLTMDPVAFDWGPDGKLWIAEMADYPNGIPDDEPDVVRRGSPDPAEAPTEGLQNDGKKVGTDKEKGDLRSSDGRGQETRAQQAATAVPSPPSSGERARVRGPNGEKTSNRGDAPSKSPEQNRKPDSSISPPHPHPLPPKAGGEGTGESKTKRAGRIRFLEDTDGDGQYDKTTLFLDGVPFPNGVISWKKGVLVSAAPDIFYAEDTDGDGKADVKKVLFTGFAEGNQQHRANGFTRGLDNWMYLANGDSGGTVTCVQSLDEALADSGSPRPGGHRRFGGPGRGVGGEGRAVANSPVNEKQEEPLTLILSPQSRGEGTKPKSEEKKIDIRGRDIRIRPDTGEIEAVTGQTQFGRNRDDWGNWFGNNNSRPMYHYVLDDHYLRRNPHLAAPHPQKDVSVAPGAAPVFPSSRTLTRFNDFHTANRFTSACSSMVYRDEMLKGVGSGQWAVADTGPPLSHSLLPTADSPSFVFISEPVHNLVHREIMRPDGISFTSQRAVGEEQSEFLSSTDNWFRPTQLKTGPDGALYVADMYRLVIEHPQWIPIEWQKKLDLRAGHDKGRLWRVAPVGAKLRAVPRLDKLTTTELVAALDSPNGWQRDLVQQLLTDRADSTAVPLLRAMVQASDVAVSETSHRAATVVPSPPSSGERARVRGADVRVTSKAQSPPLPNPPHQGEGTRQANPPPPNPLPPKAGGEGTGKATNERPSALARLHALCTLSGFSDGLTVEVVVAGLNDPHPGVRRHAVRLCEQAGLPKGDLIEPLAKRVDDADPQVRLQLAYTLGEIRHTRADELLGRMAVKANGDPILMAAVLSSLNAGNLTAVLAEATMAASDQTGLLQQLLGQAAAFKNDAAVVSILTRATEPWPDGTFARWQFSAIEQYLISVERRGETFDPAKFPQGAGLPDRWRALHAAARRLAITAEAPVADRVAAVKVLVPSDDPSRELGLLERLLAPQQPPEVQSTALIAFGRMRGSPVSNRLLAAYRSLAPDLRTATANVLLSRDEWRDELLTALETKQLAPTDLDAASRQRLLDHMSKAVRERAAKLLAIDLNTDRAKLVAEYLPTVRAGGDVQHGSQLFAKRCAQCHKLGSVGHVVGPDLASLTDKSPEAMLTAILDPNRAVETKFLTFTAVTKSGVTHTGILASETASSLTLRAAEAKESTLLRNELDELLSSTKSLMPEGLEREVSPTDAAALIAYIRNNVPLPARKTFPGNAPTVAQANADGSITLTPFTAEIYGPTIVIEEKHKNLGWWSSADDTVSWTINVPRAGRYAVSWIWACEASAAGNTCVIEAAGKSLRHKVPATSSWDEYKSADLGELELPAGEVRLTAKPASRPLPALADVKSVTLTPK